jgi:hypothetical protein
MFMLEGQKFLDGKLQNMKRSMEKEKWLVHFILKISELYTSMFL